MKEVVYIDEEGRKHLVTMRDDDASELAQEIGIPVELPEIDEVLEAAKISLHNLMVDRRLYTIDDVYRSNGALANAIKICVLNPLLEIYKEQNRRR